MELKHSFVIPAGPAETWAHFQDISAVAQCFPGAKVTSAEGDDFQGTAKVKLGPVALQYSGSGSFIERDEAARRMVFEAKGRDKRGNGTAGATVKLSFSEDPGGTRADVETDLSVTGKPAQFGARMMQEVSDKLLGQFVECLQQQVGASTSVEPVETPAAPPVEPVETPPVSSVEPVETPAAPSVEPVETPGAGSDDALDLGATVLPVVARMYGKQIGAAVLVLLVLRWLWGRRA